MAGSLGWLADASFLACPSCGARLVAKTSDRPPRLICVSCGRLLPQTTPQPLLGLLEQSQYRGRDHVRRTERQGSLEPSRWDFRTGIVRRGQR
jgi:DNA-directed RNA polymerase subunit RPC12/RpoP